jgi:type II secretory pathway component PulF
MMFKAGVPIVESLEKSESVTGNTVISKQLAGGTEAAKRGGEVSQGFSKSLPRDFLELWRTGEEAGSLDTITKKLGDNHSFTAELLLKNLAVWLPRIIYAFIAIRLIIAIFKLQGLIYGRHMNL